MSKSTTEAFEHFFTIIQKLRSPEGCPWDLEQTAESLKPSIIEEAYECVDAIANGNNPHIKEELGDLFLLAAMVSYIKEQDGSFSVADVLHGISDKLIRRHPHVFGESTADTSSDVLKQWDDIKRAEKKEDEFTNKSILDNATLAYPPLERSLMLQKAAVKVGFDWESIDDVWSKIEEEMEELKEACHAGAHQGIEEEVGDLLFTLVNISRFLKVDPMIALHQTNQKFYSRFHAIEEEAAASGRPLEDMSLSEMDAIWNRSKGRG